MSEKCIIFDCDGVLVDSEKVANRILAELIQPYGIDMSPAEVTSRFKGAKMANVILEVEALAGRSLPDDFVPLYRKEMYAAFENELEPIDGIAEALDAITNPKCVASSGPLEKMDITLSTAGLSKYFRGKIFSSYVINSWKPAPDLFLHAASEMGFDPQDCIVVEDSSFGVEAAIAADMNVLCYCEDHDGEEMESLGAHIFHRMNALPDLIHSMH
jgi:HAD superfamily hydrolase (TIGR01509 family)